MYYFLFGENTYLIKEKVDQVRKKFALAENSEFNLANLSGSQLTINQFVSEVMAAPFLSNKRLIIIKNVLLENKDNELKKYIADNLTKIPESSIVFFTELGLPDMRTSLFKKLNVLKIAQKFDLFTGRQLADWMEEKCQNEGLFIDREAREELALASAGDLWYLDNELKKIFLYVRSQKKDKISVSDIEKIATVKQDSNIFEFIESLAEKNEKRAILSLNKLQRNGENEIYILSMIVYQFRTMLIVDDLGSKDLNNQEIAREAKLHPFVVTNTKNLLRRYKKNSLVSAYDLLQKTDADIKQGRIDPKTALDLLVCRLCQNFE